MTVCTHTHKYWAGIVRTCPLCGSSYDKTPAENALAARSMPIAKAEGR